MLVGRHLSHIMDRIKAQSIHNEVVYCYGRMLFISTTLWLHSPSPSESNPAKKLCLDKFRRARLLILLQIELGTACGKLYRCSTMVVLDGGDSDILSQVVA
jgi:hypothetical protein